MEELRYQLIDIMVKAEFEECGSANLGKIQLYTDALVKAGVLLPKFKVGQEVWYLVQGEVHSSAVLATEFRSKEIYYTLKDEWGGVEREFYSTEAEARAALSGDTIL